jgi:hypothetical protein
MRLFGYSCVVLVLLACSGCTEMRIEGDAKVFQSSAVGVIIRNVIGLGLIGVGVVGIVGSVMPDRKPPNRYSKPSERLSSVQRVGLAALGGSAGFAGVMLIVIPLLFPSKLHVTVYPDRVALASTYSQTGGREVVVPFAGLAAVELRDEPNVVGKFRTYLVFTQKDGRVIKQDAGNNERQALDTIRQALADYQGSRPASNSEVATTASPSRARESIDPRRQGGLQSGAASRSERTQRDAPAKQYALKRYEITIPVPAGYRVVRPDDTVDVGSKLKACYAGSWFVVTVVAQNEDGTVTCNWDSFPSYTYKMMRQDLIMEDSRAATDPSASTSPVGSAGQAASTSSPYTLKRYKIDLPIPQGHSVVGPDTDVKVGMKLQAGYAGRWESVTVVAVNADGTIACNWDKWRSFTYNMVRDDLIIAEQDVR